MRKVFVLGLVTFFVFINGCAVIFQPGRRSDVQKIETLEDELDELRSTKSLLEKRLAKEIKDKQVMVKVEDKGLVITFVAEVLFDSGKAVLRPESFSSLDKVVSILEREAVGNNIGVEGHTDNEPIKHSSWKSNWELSVQRALSVLYYLEQNNIDSRRLSVIGYGEYKPVVPNDTVEGKQTNRRVEIVILPNKKVSKVGVEKKSMGNGASIYEDEKEELK